MSLGSSARQFIRANRRSKPLSVLASICEKYLRAWYNEAFYNFENNGEAFVLRQIAKWERSPLVIWDVGSHRGGWSDAAHEYLPNAHIHSFEIIGPIAEEIAKVPWRTVHAVGLSDKEGEVAVHWNKAEDTTNSISPRSESRWFTNGTDVVHCRTSTGDIIAETLPLPHVLKIDVEGHETAVLRGMQKLLSGNNAPAVIQIEYGDTYLPSGSTLRDVYSLLPGYSVGRLFPNHVDFKPYSYTDDNFRMGNMIATRDDALRSLLR